MKKIMMYLSVAAMAAGLLAGCGKQEEAAEGLAALKTEDYVTLGQYTGFEASAKLAEVTEENVEEQLIYLMQDTGALEEVTDRAVQKWDTATIDYVGTLDGVAFEGGTAQDYPLTIGSNSFIPGFEDGLIGVQSGETVEIPLTFPESYQNAELAGKDVIFTVTVKKIEAYVLTDEVAQQINPETLTAEELRQSVKEALNAQAERNYELSIQSQLIDQIEAGCEWKQDVPEEIVQNYLDRIKSNLEQIAQLSGATLEELLNYQFGIETSQFEISFTESATAGAKEDIILQAIANEQNLNPTEEEIETARKEGMEQGGYESLEAYKEAVGDMYYNQNIRDYLMAEKVTDYLKENAVISEP